MIKKFGDWVNESFEHSQHGETLPNGRYVNLKELKYSIGDGSYKNVTVSSASELIMNNEYDTELLTRDYPDFTDVLYISNVFNGHPITDEFYIVFGNDKDGYDYEEIDSDEFEKEYC